MLRESDGNLVLESKKMNVHYQLRPIKKLHDIQEGTQIAVKCAFKNLHPDLKRFYPMFEKEPEYYHHGVYIGEHENHGRFTVAHFSGTSKDDAKPQGCDFLEFTANAADNQIYEVVHDNPQPIQVEETLRRAQSVLDNPGIWPGYQIMLNNCEHFANWLKIGESVSMQIEFAAHKFISVAAEVMLTSSGVSAGSLQNIISEKKSS